MGSIGIYDYDFMNYNLVIPNLECAKLLTYYKQKRNITVLIPEFVKHKYEKVIMRKDYEDYNYDKELYNNLTEYGGRVFSHKYLPLDIEIEKKKPDIYAYKKYLDKFSTKVRDKDLFRSIISGAHLRLSLDGKNVWGDYMEQFSIEKKGLTIFLHDYDLGKIHDAKDAIKDIIKLKRKYLIANKFPLILEDEQELYDWLQFPLNTSYFNCTFNNYLSNSLLYEISKLKKYYLLKMGFTYNITKKCFDENDFINNRLEKIYKQVLFLKNTELNFSLTYDENFFIDKRWEKLIVFLNKYIAYTKQNCFLQKNVTLYEYVKILMNFKRYKTFDFNEMREIFQLVREKNYTVFSMFYEYREIQFQEEI